MAETYTRHAVLISIDRRLGVELRGRKRITFAVDMILWERRVALMEMVEGRLLPLHMLGRREQ
jgi:hypothetical protein